MKLSAHPKSLGEFSAKQKDLESSPAIKIHILIGAMLFWFGAGVAALTYQPDELFQTGIYALISISGLCWYLLAKVYIWWHHR